jgi:hypothetical protein
VPAVSPDFLLQLDIEGRLRSVPDPHHPARMLAIQIENRRAEATAEPALAAKAPWSPTARSRGFLERFLFMIRNRFRRNPLVEPDIVSRLRRRRATTIEFFEKVRQGVSRYRQSMSEDARLQLDRLVVEAARADLSRSVESFLAAEDDEALETWLRRERRRQERQELQKAGQATAPPSISGPRSPTSGMNR